MKVLLFGATAGRGDSLSGEIKEMADILACENIESETVTLPVGPVQGCISCGKCKGLGKCVFEDQVNVIAAKLKDCNGFVVASPVHMAAAPGELTSLLNRLFTSIQFDMGHKVGAALAEPRAGTLSTTYELNKYLAMAGMPIVSPTPGGQVTGAEARLKNIRSLTANMIFLMRAIAMGEKANIK